MVSFDVASNVWQALCAGGVSVGAWEAGLELYANNARSRARN